MQQVTSGLKPASAEKNLGNFTKEQFEMLKAASQDGVTALVNHDIVDDKDMTAAEYSTVTYAFSGTAEQLGPLIADVITAIGIRD